MRALEVVYILAAASVICPAAGAAPATPAEPPVTIDGGPDTVGQVYTWTVTNRCSSPIVYVAFPHYRGNLFFAPDGWDTSESTFLVAVGVPDRPGVCVARVASPDPGIEPTRSGEFRLQLAARGAKRRTGEVTVRFADGSTAMVAGVALPLPEAAGDKYVALIGLGAIFAVWLAVRAVRHRRTQTQSPPPDHG